MCALTHEPILKHSFFLLWLNFNYLIINYYSCYQETFLRRLLSFSKMACCKHFLLLIFFPNPKGLKAFCKLNPNWRVQLIYWNFGKLKLPSVPYHKFETSIIKINWSGFQECNIISPVNHHFCHLQTSTVELQMLPSKITLGVLDSSLTLRIFWERIMILVTSFMYFI